MTVPSGNFDAADGQLSVVCLRNEMFHALAKALGHEEWATDPRFADNEARQRNVDTLHDLLAGIFPTQSREYWINRLNQAGVLCGPVNSYSSLREDAQVEALRLLADVDHPDFGAFPFPAFPGAQRAADERRRRRLWGNTPWMPCEVRASPRRRSTTCCHPVPACRRDKE